MWILLDNYDSFTYMLHDYLVQAGGQCTVYRNDALTLQQLIDLQPERLILSPGPETPLQAGITLAAIDYFHTRIPILGVCLGHQALGMYFGGAVVQAAYPMHGKVSEVVAEPHPLFAGIPNPFAAMRYHSLVVTGLEGTPLHSIAHTADGTIMALAHQQWPCVGVQFHPESVGTPHGLTMIKNWAALYGGS